MYKLTTYTELELAHRLTRAYTGKCRHLHGHRYQVEIQLGADDLNKNEMVIDFKKLKEIVKDVLDDRWDHALALAKDDPLVPDVLKDPENSRVHVLPANPTLEYMVKVWYIALKASILHLKHSEPESIAPTAHLISIKASETAKNTCEYSETSDNGQSPAKTGCTTASSARAECTTASSARAECSTPKHPAEEAEALLATARFSRLFPGDSESLYPDEVLYMVSYWLDNDHFPKSILMASTLKGADLLEDAVRLVHPLAEGGAFTICNLIKVP